MQNNGEKRALANEKELRKFGAKSLGFTEKYDYLIEFTTSSGCFVTLRHIHWT